MSAGDIMTMKQAKEKMEYYREIFDVVRLIDEESLSESETEWKCDTADTDKCYHIWGKNKRCKNCISRKAFCEKRQQLCYCKVCGNRWNTICTGTGRENG